MSKRVFDLFADPLALLLVSGLALVAGFGCGDPGKDDPKVHAVKGTVKFKNGTPLAKGFVQFRGANPDEVINGLTEADGSFALTTLLAKNNRKLAGAPAGEYEVTITLPMAQDQSGGGEIRLPVKYTVKAQDDNNFLITIEPPRKGSP